MAWTLPTAVFFAAIASALLVLIALELKRPTLTSRGWLPMATTRGDRFFISLLGAAFIHLLWLGALLAFAGLTSVPAACYQAAELDGASKWQVFRHVELPRLKGVLVIAVLLRLMDSFMIYTEPFVLTGGGPGNTTTFLSQYLATMAVGQFDLGPAAAFSVIYFLFILLFSWLFYTSVMRSEEDS
jgi:glycerol transport system permease protein